MRKNRKSRAPTVLISSTVEDLQHHRERARDAALAAGFYPRMMEYFPASQNPPLEECLARVSGSDLLIAIVAHRYGWVPSDQPEGEYKSITWLECLEAAGRGLEILAFLADEQADWPDHLYEDYELREAIRHGKAGQKDPLRVVEQVQRNAAALNEFKSWLQERGLVATFSSLDGLQSKIHSSLHHWLERHPDVHSEPQENPQRYLRGLREETAYIDIRGLQVGSGRATRFPIEELYISLKMAPLQDPDSGRKTRPALSEQPKQQLEQALASPRLVVIGDPGGGKTTFLRRICHLVCLGILDDDTEAVQALGFEDLPFPILIRLSDLQVHRTSSQGRSGAPTAQSPEWLVDFLAYEWAEEGGGLDARFFRRKLQEGPALLLLDGLDETASEKERRSLVRWIEKVSDRWEKCRIVVTSRPAAYRGESVLPGFTHARIESLGDSAIETFFSRWCQALFPSDVHRAEGHKRELLDAVRLRPDIRRMAGNPVMLTALGVLHWNEKRLPEQRADLFESILTWLARSREDLPERSTPERCLTILQSLALAMQEHKNRRQFEVSRRWAAEALAPLWREGSERERIAAAERFLDQEEQDSGIVVRRGSELRFWHLTFQEYLAARSLAGLANKDMHRILLRHVGSPEWLEVIALLPTILHSQGVECLREFLSVFLDPFSQAYSTAEATEFQSEGASVLREIGSFLRVSGAGDLAEEVFQRAAQLQSPGDERETREPQITQDELLELLFLLVSSRRIPDPRFLHEPKARTFRAVLGEMELNADGHRDALQKLRSEDSGLSPDPLWMSWMKATRSDLLDSLVEAISQ